MGTIRKFIVDAALLALVIAFVLFWVFAGVGMPNISMYAAFLVFVAASILLVATQKHAIK